MCHCSERCVLVKIRVKCVSNYMLRICSVNHVLYVNPLCKRSEPRGTLCIRFNWHWEFLKVGQSVSPITQCFLLWWKISLLWFVYKGWLLPARTCLTNLSLQHQYCLLVFSQSFPFPNKVSLLTYLCSDEQLFYVALVFQNDTNIDFFRKFSKSLGSAAELHQAFFQMIVHWSFRLLHISGED